MTSESRTRRASKIVLERGDTCLFPEYSTVGIWRLQTTDPHVIRTMRRRCRKGKKWWQVGWGMNAKSPDIFASHFSSRWHAERAIEGLVSDGQSKRLVDPVSAHNHHNMDTFSGRAIDGNGGAG